MKRVLVFGTFDGLHPGHRAMLTEAATHGHVVVCLALDSTVMRLKHHAPRRVFNDRQRELLESGLAKEVIAGDDDEGGYECLQRAKPDLIAFGYDQDALRQDFVNWQQRTRDVTPHLVLQPYEPSTYKSSLLV